MTLYCRLNPLRLHADITLGGGGGTANTAYLSVQSAGKGDNVFQSAQAAAEALKSCKGLKSGGELTIYDGTFTVDAADNTLHADANLTSGETVSLYVNNSSMASATAAVSGSAYTYTPSTSGSGDDTITGENTATEAGMKVFAAWYSGDGKLLDVRTASASGGFVTLANAAPEDAAELGVFVVNDVNAPVCTALRMDLD